jgi:hypothetical protein
MFLVDFNPLGGNVTALEVVPFQIRRLQLATASVNKKTSAFPPRPSDGLLPVSKAAAKTIAG